MGTRRINGGRDVMRKTNQLRKDINIFDRISRGQIGAGKEGKAKLVEERHRVRRQGLIVVIEELKQRVIAKAANLARYEQRIHQYKINRLFKVDQKKVYNEFNGQTASSSRDIPDAEECRTFWNGIWSVEKEHSKEADWLSGLKEEIVRVEQQNVAITEDKVKKQCRKMPYWKTPGHDWVQGFWTKRLDSMHKRIATQLNLILEGTKELPSWMTYGRSVLCQKDAAKVNSVDNFRPITCPPLTWKFFTGIVAEDMYLFMENNHLLQEEQKGCRSKSKGTKDQLLIDNTILKDCRKRKTNLAMAWIDYIERPMILSHTVGF